jgi:hypothetical protein
MGREFDYKICVNSCECGKKYTCVCVGKCKVNDESKLFPFCNCQKIYDNRFYLRNNSHVWEMLNVGESPAHFSYQEIEGVLNKELEKVDKIEILKKTSDEIYNNDDDWQLIITLGDMLRIMRKKNSKCVWMTNC